MFYYLYKITNSLNGQIYIGVHKTKNLDDGYFGSSKFLNEDITKFGKNNFIKEILEFFDDYDSAFLKEREIVNEEFLLQNVYNKCLGGRGGFHEEMVRRARSPSAREKRIKTFKERKCHVGNKNSQFGIKRIGINKNGIIKKVLPENLNKFLKDGWIVGFSVKKPKINKIESKRKELIKRIILSNVDITQKGWPLKMSKDVGMSRSAIKKFIKKNIPELYSKCLIENNMIRKHNA